MRLSKSYIWQTEDFWGPIFISDDSNSCFKIFVRVEVIFYPSLILYAAIESMIPSCFQRLFLKIKFRAIIMFFLILNESQIIIFQFISFDSVHQYIVIVLVQRIFVQVKTKSLQNENKFVEVLTSTSYEPRDLCPNI